MALQQGAIGVTFQLTITENGSALDVSGATTKRFDFKKPDGTVVPKEAVFVSDGTDGKLKYVSLADDIDTKGVWRLQAYLVIGTFTGYSAMVDFTVKPNVS